MRKWFTLSNVTRVVVALILLQTLYFKFTAAPESVYIFSRLGVEPWGRVATGILELSCAGLLLYRPTMLYGAIGSLAISIGALCSHLFVLGIEVREDGGTLFGLALVVLIGSILLLYLHWQDLPFSKR